MVDANGLSEHSIIRRRLMNLAVQIQCVVAAFVVALAVLACFSIADTDAYQTDVSRAVIGLAGTIVGHWFP